MTISTNEEQAINNLEEMKQEQQQQLEVNSPVVVLADKNGADSEAIEKSNLNSNDPSESGANRCNLTLVLHEILRMELEQRPLPPKPKANEVSLATHTVGICGSDVKYWQQGKIGNFILKKPMILGHETSAIVMEVGSEVKSLRPGDKVAVEVGLPCSACALCKNGKYNLCSQMAFAATPPYDGTLTRYFNHPADFCFKLPESVSLEEGALLEPLAVAVHACKRAPVKLGNIILVCGAGAVGLLSMLAAKAFGASYVIVTDVLESRLSFAKQLGADKTYLVDRNTKPSELGALIKEHIATVAPDSNGGVDITLECSGAESSMNLAIQSAGIGSTIVCVGCQPDTVNLSLSCALSQEIDIKGVFRYRNCYPLAMSLVQSGKIDLKPLITHRFQLENAKEAFETCHKGIGVKILINCMHDDKTGSNGKQVSE